MRQKKKMCIRCLMQDMEETEEYEKLKTYLDTFDADIRTSETEYKRRLKICRACTSLNRGICIKCGCFVEARALRRQGTCPHERPRW